MYWTAKHTLMVMDKNKDTVAYVDFSTINGKWFCFVNDLRVDYVQQFGPFDNSFECQRFCRNK